MPPQNAEDFAKQIGGAVSDPGQPPNLEDKAKEIGGTVDAAPGHLLPPTAGKPEDLEAFAKQIGGQVEGTEAGAPSQPGFFGKLFSKETITGPGTIVGKTKEWLNEAHHVVPGSDLEKTIQDVEPGFKGTAPTPFYQRHPSSLMYRDIRERETPEKIQERQAQAAMTARDIEAPIDIAQTAPIDVAQAIDKKQHPVLKALAEQGQSLLSPANVALMIGTGGLGMVANAGRIATASRIMAAGWAIQSVAQAYKHFEAFREAYDSGDASEALYQFTHLVASGALTAATTAEAAGKPMEVVGAPEKAAAKAVGEAVPAAAKKIVSAVTTPAQALAQKAGFGEPFEEMVRKYSPPSAKVAAEGYGEKVIKTAPLLRDILNSDPNSSKWEPNDFVDAIEQRRKGIEGQLLSQASGIKGTPEAQMPGIINGVSDYLTKFFEKEGARYKPEEQAKAIQEVQKFMMQQGGAGAPVINITGEGLTEPEIWDVEKIRQRFNDDTRTTFGAEPGDIPPATVAAKRAAADFLRKELDTKYGRLGIQGVKEWRGLEADLIDVRDNLARAQKRAEEMGNFNLISAAIKKSGWPIVLGALGHGEVALAAEAFRIGQEYVTDRVTNPNTIIRRISKVAAKTPAGVTGEPEFGQPRQPSALGPVPAEFEEPHIDDTPRGMDTKAVLNHELGHVKVAKDKGFNPRYVVSREHPENVSPTAVATAVIDWGREFDRKPGEPYPIEMLRKRLNDVLDVHLAGAAANELYDNIPFAENRALHGDLRQVHELLDLLQVPESEHDSYIEAAVNRAKTHLEDENTTNVINEFSDTREPHLPSTHHYSAGRILEFLDRVGGEHEGDATSAYEQYLEQRAVGKPGGKEGAPGEPTPVAARAAIGRAAAEREAPGVGEKAAKIEAAQVRGRPEWIQASLEREIQRAKDILRNPEATPEEKKYAEQLLESSRALQQQPSLAGLATREGPRIPPEGSVTPEADKIIKAAGAIPYALQKGEPEENIPDYALFHDPTSGSTLAYPMEKLSEQAVRQQLEKSRAQYREAAERQATKAAAMKKAPIAEGADVFNAEHGRPAIDAVTKEHDPEFAMRVADAYDTLTHNPNDPEVKAAYGAMKRDIRNQWDFATQKMGIKFEPWETSFDYKKSFKELGKEKPQPYANSKEMMADINDNRHLYFFQGGTMAKDHPLAEVDPETGYSYNDMLRAVHDLFGHAAHGFQFGPKGEENAYLVHRQMFSPEAIPALTTETRAQNSWFNYGSHLRNAEGKVIQKGEPGYVQPSERPFAENKAALLPPEMQQARPTAAAEYTPPTADYFHMFASPEEQAAGFEPGKWNIPEHIKPIAKAIATQDAGAVNPQTGEPDPVGRGLHGVEIVPESRERFANRPTERDITAFGQKNADLFSKHPELRLGWDHDPTNHPNQPWELNIGAAGTPEGAATVGKRLDQRASFNIDEGKDVPLGGKNKQTNFPDYSIEQRLADLKGRPEPVLGGLGASTRPQVKGSTVKLMKNPLKIEGTGELGGVTTMDVAKALSEFTKTKLPPLELGKVEPEAMVKRAKSLAEDEAKYQLAQNNTGESWYTKDMIDHDKTLQEIRPELSDPAKMSLFKMNEAVHSSGQKPYQNLKSALKAWDIYHDTGKFPELNPETQKSWGPRGIKAYGSAIDSINRLIQAKGEKGASDWLLVNHPVRELREWMQPTQSPVAGKADDLQPGAMILGPKRGPFAQNLHGQPSAFTADMWVSRTWNRWMGTTEVDPETGEVTTDSPRSGKERDLMRQSFQETAQKLKITTSALQAVLWYYEQALYDAHGSAKESWNFADAAKRVAEEDRQQSLFSPEDFEKEK